MVISETVVSTLASLRALATASNAAGSVRISQFSPSSFRSSPPASRTMFINLSSSAAALGMAIKPFLANEPNRIGFTKVAPVFREGMADFADGAIAIVGRNFDNQGYSAGAVAFKRDLLVNGTG